MKKESMFRCLLCGRQTFQRCTYCKEPICKHCQTVGHGKTYCTPRHRDMDTGIGRILRHLEESVR
jgi:hypothetical protein